MDRFTSNDLLASSNRVTRHDMKKFKSVFPFLRLPAELRNMIYECATDNPQRLADYFDRYYERLLAARAKPQPYRHIYVGGHGRMLLPPKKKAPNVFFLNKQIFAEASYLFFNGNHNITFAHGMLEFQRLREVIAPKILQNITSITISDAGHNEIIQLQNNGVTESLPCSWNGYMRLITQLGLHLSANGHKLKEFTIDFSRDTRLGEHLIQCAQAYHICGFKDQFQLAINTLHGIRGVKNVTLIGLNPVQAAKLKARMESKPVNFSDMPLKVRNLIYDYASGWNDISSTIMKAVGGRRDRKMASFPYPYLTTPTVLLMNKKYSAEALKVLNKSKEVLRFELPADHGIKPTDMPGLSRFVGRTSLKNVRAVEIVMESRDWVESFDRHFLSALDSMSSKLEAFDLVFLDDQINQQYPEYPDAFLRNNFSKLHRIRNLKSATISGSLPICYSDPLAMVLVSAYRAPLPKTRVLRRGIVVDLEDGGHHVAQY